MPIDAQGNLGEQSQALPITGGYDIANLPNGIETTPDNSALIVAMTRSGTLVRVDPTTGVSTTIDLGTESAPGADGILCEGNTHYVVQGEVAKLELNNNGTTGTVITRVDDDRFDRNTTAAYGDRLYMPNARSIATTTDPNTEYRRLHSHTLNPTMVVAFDS